MEATPPAPTGPDSAARFGGDESASTKYAVAVGITVVVILSQYLVPGAVPAAHAAYSYLPTSFLLVYGVPIVAFAFLVGSAPVRRFATEMRRASWEGLRWYGLLSLLALLVTIALVAVYTVVDPAAVKLLQRPNPVLEQARSNPWFWVALSFAVGAAEELIFRGWIFGYWLTRATSSWVGHAAWTSALFAAVHLYYGVTYGVIAPISFSVLFLIGFAFAATVRASGGNLVIVAALHGANDATAFYSLVSSTGSLVLHYGIVLLGALVGLVAYIRSRSRPPPVAPPPVPGESFRTPPELGSESLPMYNAPPDREPTPSLHDALRRTGIPGGQGLRRRGSADAGCRPRKTSSASS